MSIQTQLGETASLLRATDAMRNVRAGALLLGSLVLAVLAGVLGAIVSAQVHVALGLVFFLLSFAIYFYGANAVGIMMMDEAKGGTARPVLSAVLTSLAISHRTILLMLLVGLTYFVGALVMALLLAICKVPGIGPALFAFVFPLCVVVSGFAIFAGYAVIVPLAGPAVWAGATVLQALSQLAAIARQRVVVVILSVLVLLIICGVVGGTVLGIMLTGTFVTGAMSAGIIGVNGIDLSTVMMGMSGSGFGGGGSGHLAAGAFGWGLVMTIAITLPLLVYVRGCCQLYLSNMQGVDVEAMERQLRGSLDAAKRSAAEIRAKGEAMAAQQMQRAEVPRGTAPPVLAPSALQYKCAACGAPYLPGDLFCGGCGHKLAA